jgi:hypothetical protein
LQEEAELHWHHASQCQAVKAVLLDHCWRWIWNLDHPKQVRAMPCLKQSLEASLLSDW